MLKCVIIDDEDFAIDIIKGYIEQIDELDLVFTTTDAIEGFNYIINNKEDIDILYLDIEMPNLSGDQLIKLIPTTIKTVFTTAFSKYAVEAFSLGAQDYLLKPIEQRNFLQSFTKISGNIIKLKTNSFFINVDKKLIKINTDEVIHVEGMKNFLGISCKQKRIYVCTNTFKEIEKYLIPPKFVRVNKSHIISFDSILSVEGNIVNILIETDLKTKEKAIPIGGTYKKNFISLINKI